MTDLKADDRKIGIFGGTFNPAHYGHLRAAEEVRVKLGFGKVIFIPSCNPPIKAGDLASFEHRYEMVRLSIETNTFFGMSDIECRRAGKSYTVETLAELQEIYRENELYLILGIDSFLDIPIWYQPERLMEMANFAVISRPGYTFTGLSSMLTTDRGILAELDACLIDVHRTNTGSGRNVFLLNVTSFDISATSVRNLVKGGKSLKYLLPESVESYIIANKLYMEGSEDL